MKMITAIIKHFMLDSVREALGKLNIQGMTVTEVKGFGTQKGHVELYKGLKYEVNFLPKVKLEVAVADNDTEATIQAIIEAARTGEIGDGKIFVTELTEVVRIRTEERGEKAL